VSELSSPITSALLSCRSCTAFRCHCRPHEATGLSRRAELAAILAPAATPVLHLLGHRRQHLSCLRRRARVRVRACLHRSALCHRVVGRQALRAGVATCRTPRCKWAAYALCKWVAVVLCCWAARRSGPLAFEILFEFLNKFKP
jgi:hypothetical protein